MSIAVSPAVMTVTMDGIDLTNTIGALLIGALFSAVLYGITSTQALAYYRSDYRDPWYIKLAVSVLWMLDTWDMSLIFHILYWYLIDNYGNPMSLAEPVWSIVLQVMVTSLTQVVVRGMFAIRVWRMSQENWIPIIAIGCLSTVDLVCSIVITVKAFRTTFSGLKHLDPLVYTEFVAGVAGDFLVALCLCYFLHRSRTGYGRTESVINILMAYILNTGLFTAITSSIGLILFAVEPNNLIYIAIYLQLSKLYVNAYLAMLNARDRIRDRSNDHIHLSRLSNTGPIIHSMVAEPRKTNSVSMVGGTDVSTMIDSYKGRTSVV